MSNPSDDYAYFATYVVSGGAVLQTGGCSRADLPLQSANLPAGVAVMEITPGQLNIAKRHRVDLVGGVPRFVEA